MKNVVKHPAIRGSEQEVRQRLAPRFHHHQLEAVDSSRRSLASLRRLSRQSDHAALRRLLPVYESIIDELAAIDCQSPLAARKLAEINHKLEEVSQCVANHVGSTRLVS